MEYSFPHYLLSKQSVDDRALNKDVLKALELNLPRQPIRVIEVGAGIGTMLRRLLRWDVIQKAEYILVDEMVEKYPHLSAGDRGVVHERIATLQERIEAYPKTARWKVRSRVGERVKWYKDVEELMHR